MESFAFIGWNTASDGDGTEFTGDTNVNESITVYAQWEFIGGTPEVVDDTLVHKRPLFEAGGNSTLNNNTGTYSLSGTNSWIQYLFPEEVIVNSYDYFVLIMNIAGVTGSPSTVNFNKHGTSTALTGGGTAKSNWLSNLGSKAVLEVQGAGDTGGFRIQGGHSSTDIPNFTVTSITFYKAPRYTVSFDANYEGADEIPDVTDIWGTDSNHEGYAVGEANWPTLPDRTTEDPPMYFVAWKDADGAIFTPNTRITGETLLTAEWTDTPDTRYMEKITNTSVNAGGALFAFELPEGSKLGDYTQFTCKIKVAASSGNGRIRAFGPMNTSVQTTSETLPNVGSNNVLSTALLNSLPPSGDLVTDNNFTFNQAVGNTWRTYTLNILSDKPRNWDNNTTGIVLFTLGVNGGAGQSWTGSYYIKDIELTKSGGADPVAAIRPDDTKLWDGGKPGVFARGAEDASLRVVREIVAYEEED